MPGRVLFTVYWYDTDDSICIPWDMVNAVVVAVMVMLCPEDVILEIHCPIYL